MRIRPSYRETRDRLQRPRSQPAGMCRGGRTLEERQGNLFARSWCHLEGSASWPELTRAVVRFASYVGGAMQAIALLEPTVRKYRWASVIVGLQHALGEMARRNSVTPSRVPSAHRRSLRGYRHRLPGESLRRRRPPTTMAAGVPPTGTPDRGLYERGDARPGETLAGGSGHAWRRGPFLSSRETGREVVDQVRKVGS